MSGTGAASLEIPGKSALVRKRYLYTRCALHVPCAFIQQQKAHVDLAAPVVSLNQETNLFQSYESQDGRWRVLITRTAEKPMWSTSDSIHNMMFDLHIYYAGQASLLFEATTRPGIAREIRGNFGRRPTHAFPTRTH